MSGELFVPADFAVPGGLACDEGFRLEPLGPQHNEADYAAWTGSIDHIRATPGFTGRSWPHPMSLEDGRARGAAVQSWVRADRAQLDRALYGAVLVWLQRDWPFLSIEYAPRAQHRG